MTFKGNARIFLKLSINYKCISTISHTVNTMFPYISILTTTSTHSANVMTRFVVRTISNTMFYAVQSIIFRWAHYFGQLKKIHYRKKYFFSKEFFIGIFKINLKKRSWLKKKPIVKSWLLMSLSTIFLFKWSFYWYINNVYVIYSICNLYTNRKIKLNSNVVSKMLKSAW